MGLRVGRLVGDLEEVGELEEELEEEFEEEFEELEDDGRME